MEEARRVLARLSAIESLERSEAPPPLILAEVRVLLAELEHWLRREPCATPSVLPALERCRVALRRAALEAMPVL